MRRQVRWSGDHGRQDLKMNEAEELLKIAKGLFANENYNIKAKYRYWNSKGFGGELPSVSMGWTRSKTVGGRVTGTAKVENRLLYNLTGEGAKITIKKLELSNFLARDEEFLDSILLHEMVHVYVMGVLGRNEPRGGHGRKFLEKRKEVALKTGVKIPLTEDLSGTEEISKEVPSKEVAVILMEMSGRKLMQVLNKNAFMRAKNAIMEKLGIYPWVRVLLSDERRLLMFPEQRKFGRRWVYVKSDLWNAVLQGGRVLEKIG